MNKIKLSGEIVRKPIFSHKTKEKDFYEFYMSSKRLSGASDIIPCIVSDGLLIKILENEKICLHGEIRTYNKYEGDHAKLLVYIYVKAISQYMDNDENCVEIDGFICKEPCYRKTQLGREIADILLAVNRPYGKSDYIPCICWGEDARKMDAKSLETELKLCGRIQSRFYIKKLEDGTQEKRVAYEISVKNIENL